MPTLSSHDDKDVTETRAVAGGQKIDDKARQFVKTHDVLGKLGHQDGVRRGEAKKHCTYYGRSQCFGWILAALQREMDGLEGQATFECVESNSLSPVASGKGASKTPRLWLNMAMQILANVEQGCVRQEWVSSQIWRDKNSSVVQLYVGRKLLGHVPFEGSPGTDDKGSNSGSRKMRSSAETCKFIFDKYLRLRGEGGPFN